MKTIKHKREPAYSVIITLGGVRATARILDIAPSAVSRWLLPRKKTKAGLIPQEHWSRILEHCKLNKIKLSIGDLTHVR